MDRHNSNITEIINKILEGEKQETAEEFLNKLYDTYQNFSSLSQRILRTLRLQMPHKNSKVGLSHFILETIKEHENEKLDFESIRNYVNDGFEYTVTPKAISDSLHYLKKSGDILNFKINRNKK